MIDVRSLPKVLLHDHLDGGLRPSTVLALSDQQGFDDLPTADARELQAWFTRSVSGGDLEEYLRAFEYTVRLMQSAESLHRVAKECAEDLAADGVIYAEVRFAPELHTRSGLLLDEVVDAVAAGFADGSRGRGIDIGIICTAMRTAAASREIAELAVRHRERGVVAFDVAGPEKGYPPTRYLDAFDYVRRHNFNLTIHAGEGFGLPSIWEAVQLCGAHRLGHGVRIVDDIAADGSLGALASFVRDRRIPMEVCPTSNVHTSMFRSIAEHPIDLLKRLRFRVTVNTDNRLMSGVSLSSEFQGLVDAFGYGLDDLTWFSVNAAKSAFLPFDERLALIDRIAAR